MFLFDASSIINLVKRGVVDPFARGATLDLALYEVLNAIWKEHRLMKRIDEDTASMFLDVINDVFNVVEVLSIRGLEKEVLDLASRENLTVYDASYLCIAVKRGLKLVTDDRKLRNRASKYVTVISSRELAGLQHGQDARPLGVGGPAGI